MSPRSGATRARTGGNRVDLCVRDCRRPAWAPRYRAFCRRLLDILGHRDRDISVLLTSDERLRDLNRRYRGLDRTTDVLSFQQAPATDGRAGPLGSRTLGDIVISLPAASRNAVRYRVRPEVEVRRLTTHGVLHLEGWDHRNARERAAMTARQEDLLGRAGRRQR